MQRVFVTHWNKKRKKRKKMSEQKPISHNGEIFEITDGLYYGYAKSQTIEKCQPLIHWQGAKIPWATYCKWASFMRWAYQEHKSEAQVNLVYHEEHRLWSEVVYPQVVAGASTLETKTGDMSLYEGQMARGFEAAGSLHSHAAMSAFQSGTDTHNEVSRSGLHITLGNLGDKELSFHSRLVFRGYQYHKAFLDEWIEIPFDLCSVPDELGDVITKYYLCHPAVEEFPPEWKARIHKQSVQSHHNSATTGFTLPWMRNNAPDDIPPKQTWIGDGSHIPDSDDTITVANMSNIQEAILIAMEDNGISPEDVEIIAKKALHLQLNAQARADTDVRGFDGDDWLDDMLTNEEAALLEIMNNFGTDPQELYSIAREVEHLLGAEESHMEDD